MNNVRSHAGRRATTFVVALVGMLAGTLVGPLASTTAAPAADGPTAEVGPAAALAGKVAYVGPGGIWAVNADGTGRVRLTDLGGDRDPAWSPDGTMIAYSSVGGADPSTAGGPDLFVVREDGTDVRRLTTGGMTGAHPSWSPDGTRIVFATYMNGRTLFIVNADGTGLHEVRSLPDDGTVDYYPSWSPDGTKIAFTHFDGADNEIYVMDVDGTNVVALTDDPGSDISPAWSPDGTRIAFASERAGGSEVFVMDADGTDVQQVTTSGEFALAPAWSPDGSMLAVTASFSPGRIVVVDLTGATVAVLAEPPDYGDTPSWVAGRVVPRRVLPVDVAPTFTG